MSQLLVQNYLNEIDRLRKFSGVSNEQVIRPAFRRLLDSWAASQKLVFLEEYPHQTTQKTIVYPDGTVLHDIRVPLGHWEAKDTSDDLQVEIEKKFRKGYPQDNIIFENSDRAILYQNRQPVMECDMTDVSELLKLLSLFFSYERQEIAEFRKAVEKFRADLPSVLGALRERIDTAYTDSPDFRAAADKFLQHARDTINPSIGEADIREMLIQHILTEEIFTHVFNEGDFHRENNIAQELYSLEGKFFTGAVKRETLKALEPYYAAIRTNAAAITSHSEKQTFLKVIYENFYKVYNPKAADRLGVVYTPNEIVKFMIEGADWLTQKHFGKALIDNDVEILDPATGTGTFVTELLQHFAYDRKKLAHKYKNELHANEVAILPYYVANLNIEATYFGITGQFAEFENLCFVDTLDNVAGLGIRSGYQHDMFAGLSDENFERVKRQNKRKISVVIGNPPYNANQQNENENNKNRTYSRIDELIKSSYIRLSTAQKTKVYDMYARFFRWASDRLHDDGVLAFITNRSFIESRTFDGFRRAVADEYNEIYIMDLGGDVRANPKLSGTKHNVFGIQTGVAISFMVKRHKQKGCKIFYARRPEFDTADDKLTFLVGNRAADITWTRVEPDKNANWINLTESEWNDLIPVADKATKSAKSKGPQRAIFRLFASGLKTNRDEWLYDFDRALLLEKAEFFIGRFNKQLAVGLGDDDLLDYSIKWSSTLKTRKTQLSLRPSAIHVSVWRPFVRKHFYSDRLLADRVTALHERIFGTDLRGETRSISISGFSSAKPFQALAVSGLADYEAIEKSNLLPRYRYTASGERIDNITDWALKKFKTEYGKDVTTDDIFHYVYAILLDPLYREKYAVNLKREFPRIPFYPDFRQWVEWGDALMKLHIGYQEVEPWPLERLDTPDERAREAGVLPKAMLKPDRDNGIIRLDTETQLSGVPKEAWDYRLGNRSGLDWILDQYKEKTPRDPTIRENFNTYRFADYKETVIDLLARVTRVSVETVAITEKMRAARH